MLFTEFIDIVKDVFSADILEDIIEKGEWRNAGVHKAVGTYYHEEIVRMTANLSQAGDIPVATLLEVFGKHLFGGFSDRYPWFLWVLPNHLSF